MESDLSYFSESQADEFVSACHRAARYGLLRYSSGNMSSRLADGYAAVTASKAWLGEITAEQIAVCRIDDGVSINDARPTVESEFHFGVLRGRADMNVVLHFQSAYATAISCGREIDCKFNVIPEIPYYIGEIGVVEYLPPGSRELADAVIAAMAEHDLIILQNHGQVVVGKDYNDAIQKAGFFELACEVICRQSDPAYVSRPEVP